MNQKKILKKYIYTLQFVCRIYKLKSKAIKNNGDEYKRK